ncbi:MAG TPA: porin, partial [Nitrosomonas sp.]|nr:porin [Nitrosomonas sp.]
LWMASAQYDVGNTSIVAQGGMSQANSTGILQKREFSQFTVGLIHNLSKRSSLFGGYQRGMVDDKNLNSAFRDSNTYTVGMRHNF